MWRPTSQQQHIIFPQYTIDKYNYPSEKTCIPIPHAFRQRYPNRFTAKNMAEALGGQLRPKIATQGGEPIRMRLREDWNIHQPERPGAPGADITLEIPCRVPEGKKEVRKGPIPIFSSRGKLARRNVTFQYEYCGDYHIIYRNDPVTQSQLRDPVIANMLTNRWFRDVAAHLRENKPSRSDESSWKIRCLGDLSRHDWDTIDWKNLTAEQLYSLFKKGKLKAYWIYLDYAYYNPDVYNSLSKVSCQELTNEEPHTTPPTVLKSGEVRIPMVYQKSKRRRTVMTTTASQRQQQQPVIKSRKKNRPGEMARRFLSRLLKRPRKPPKRLKPQAYGACVYSPP